MSDLHTGPSSSGTPVQQKGVFDRAKDILVQPKSEWGVIDAEPSTIGGIYTGYVLILAAIGPIAMLVGQQVFAGEATRLAYLTDEAVEGRDAFLEKRDPDWSPYPYAF